MRNKFYDPGTDNGGGDNPDNVTNLNQDNNGNAAATAVAPALKGQVDQATIDGWKKQYPQGIYGVQVDGGIVYFCRPKLVHLNAASEKASLEGAKPLDYIITLVNDTCIGGEEALLDDDTSMISIIQIVRSEVEAKKAALVNL